MQRETIADHGIDGDRVRNTGLDQMQCFAHQGCLQPIAEEAWHVAIEKHRKLSARRQHVTRSGQGGGIGPRRAEDFDHGYEMGWIERMGYDTAVRAG